MIFYINIFIIIILLILFYMVIITILVTITIISIFTIIISVIFIIIFNTSLPIYLSSKQSLAMFFPVYSNIMEAIAEDRSHTITYRNCSSTSTSSYLLASYQSVDFVKDNSVEVFCQ